MRLKPQLGKSASLEQRRLIGRRDVALRDWWNKESCLRLRDRYAFARYVKITAIHFDTDKGPTKLRARDASRTCPHERINYSAASPLHNLSHKWHGLFTRMRLVPGARSADNIWWTPIGEIMSRAGVEECDFSLPPMFVLEITH